MRPSPTTHWAPAASAPAVDSSAGTVGLYNTIVDLNSGTAADDVDGSIDGSNNLIGTLNQTIIDATSPGLAPALANNGGPTQTIALLAGSPALNAGASSFNGVTVPITDQRGAVRGSIANASGPANAGSAPDIGAYEASSEYQVSAAADTNDLGSLRTAVSWANISTNANLASPSAAPNTVDFGSGPGPVTITLSPALGTLDLSNTLTPVAITNSGSGSVTISGGGMVGVVQVNADVTATLSNLTIMGGSAATGGGINNAGTLTIAGLTIQANTAVGSGGGVNNAGTLNVSATTISGNNAGGSGGGINNTGVLTLAAGTTVSGNNAAASGGGIADPGTLTLTTDSISGNTAATGGGIVVGGTLTDTGSTIAGNVATGTGGGIAVQAGGSVSLSSSSVSGNVAGSSGTGSGGGIDNAGTLTLYYATVGGNSASGAGGGVANESGGTLTASYSPVTSNYSTGSGGGIDNSGVATISVSTLSGNSAAASGGGLGNELGATLTLERIHIERQLGDLRRRFREYRRGERDQCDHRQQPGHKRRRRLRYGQADGRLRHHRVQFGRGQWHGRGPRRRQGHDDPVQHDRRPQYVPGRLGQRRDRQPGADQRLRPVRHRRRRRPERHQQHPEQREEPGPRRSGTGWPANDGGPTQTVALLTGSPAIDAGSTSVGGASAPTVDQRGAVRGSRGLNAGSSPDIGAFEASSSYLVNTTVDSQDMGTLRSAITWANLSTNFNAANLAPNDARSQHGRVRHDRCFCHGADNHALPDPRGHPTFQHQQGRRDDRRHGVQRPDDQRRRPDPVVLHRRGRHGNPHRVDDHRRHARPPPAARSPTPGR